MAYEIIWSAEAKHTFLSIIDYLEREWTSREIANFVNRVNNKLDLLSSQPTIGRPHNKRHKIHKTLVHKKVSLVYHIRQRKKEIVLLSFWDDRQDPNRLKH